MRTISRVRAVQEVFNQYLRTGIAVRNGATRPNRASNHRLRGCTPGVESTTTRSTIPEADDESHDRH